MKNTSNMDGTSRKSPLLNFMLKGNGVMKCAALEPTVSNIRYLSFPLRIALAMLIVVFVSGCVERLAQKHEYFAAANDVRAKVRLETERLVTYHQAVRHGCARNGPTGASLAVPSGAPALTATPLQTAWAQKGWARLCGDPKGPYPAHGALFNGYRRWVEDRVRELPEPTDTASSVGGGS